MPGGATGRENVQKLNGGWRADRLSVRSAKNTGGAAGPADRVRDSRRSWLTGTPRWLKTNFADGLRSMPVRLVKA
jgi:hypothetical protein